MNKTQEITIYLDDEDIKSQDEVAELVDYLLAHDPNWNGGEIRIAHGDHTEIEGCDEIAGAQLLAQVRGVIDDD